MDVTPVYTPRSQMELPPDPSRNGVPEDSSGNESESLARRKFQRTAVDTNPNAAGTTFRKPSLPASATRQQHELGGSFSHRRRSTLRENVRVPSGPREFPSPGKSRVGNHSSISSLAPSATDSSGAHSFLPNIPSEPLFSKTLESSRFSFGVSSSDDDNIKNNAASSLRSAGRPRGDIDLIPAVNFDDFQTSLASYDGPLLSGFPAIGGRSEFPSDPAAGTSKSGRDERTKLTGQKPEAAEDPGLGRSESFRRRLSVAGSKSSTNMNRPSQVQQQQQQQQQQSAGLSVRTRRQSSATHQPLSGLATSSSLLESRPPRKSVGPGSISSLMDGRKSSNPLPYGTELTARQVPERVDSLNKAARRITMQPSTGGVDFPRNPSFAATTQARANKVKSLYAAPRETEPNTPNGKSSTRSSASRAQTPSSSGNKRQSTVSGRASGLGARTVSPTDTHRLQRLSMMQAPPVPSTTIRPPTTTHDELPPQLKLELPDAPRLAQPSPSMIPRKTSNPTPGSARESPDVRPNTSSAPTLSSKSSSQSLLTSSASASRLPTPKPRSIHSSSAQYNDAEELVPPVPAIPKAYESPRDAEPMPFSSSYKASVLRANNEPTLGDFDADGSFMSTTELRKAPKSQTDLIGESDRRSQTLPSTRAHRRTNTFENIERNIAASGASQQQRPNYDATGRKNNNLQPLRLPPLNLMPINTPTASKIAGLPRPSQEIEDRDDHMAVQTPEPKRAPKTPSTPMTASKATFWRRQDEGFAKQKSLRSSSSQYALRDLMQLDDGTSKFFDDGDIENTVPGVPVPNLKPRNAITPFASGSLPKNSGEYVRQFGRPSVDLSDGSTASKPPSLQLQTTKPQGPRPSRSGTNSSFKTAETPSSLESPIADSTQPESKKEGGGGLRRRLSLSWRRTSSSKAANASDMKPTARPDASTIASESDKGESVPKRTGDMPPPKLPASATWTGELPSVPRLSLDASRRKSAVPPLAKPTTTPNASQGPDIAAPLPKTKSLHSEQPQPISVGNRASSWGSIGTAPKGTGTRSIPNLVRSRHTPTPSTISAIIKDKDDLAADEEMRRLSQKRKDVDSAARESESLKQRATARSPMSPERVLHDPSSALNIFERGEIMDYEKEGVYFTGTKSARKIIGSLTASDKSSKAGNYGYDDERGDYNIVLGDHLAYRYEVVDVLGKGSFGQVVRCVDHKNGGVVAVKIIRNKKRFHQQALVEVGILGRLREWDPEGTHATLSITSSFYFRSHLCIVTPCLSINLYELIRAHNFVGFSMPLIRRFARQLLACLVLLQSKRIIHCDMKPENILLCEARKADVRVIDFGSSCKEEEKVYTYIQSRFYRSPEVILGSSYGMGIDMWSLGCILAELLTGLPLFPGENEQEQLACIMEIFGPPDRHLVERCTRKKLFFDSVGKPRVTVSSKGRRRRPSSKTLAQALKSEDEAFLDFISRCLRWDPDRRMKPHEAVNHPFITNQPMHQRQSIPDEARRAARVKSTAAMPATAATTAPSPVKRTPTTSSVTATPGNAFAQQAVQQTPAGRERVRPLPETPQTVVRATPQTNQAQPQGSPSKQLGVSRRHSSVATAGAAAMAGSKRASNGLVVGANHPTPLTLGAGQRHGSSGNLSTSSLAQMAARESMGATAAANAARWKAG